MKNKFSSHEFLSLPASPPISQAKPTKISTIRKSLQSKGMVIIMYEKEQSPIHDEMSEKIILAAKELAINHGADSITVRSILKTLGITNRVFYNRFSNITEVLDIVYKETVVKIRDSIVAKFDPDGDFLSN